MATRRPAQESRPKPPADARAVATRVLYRVASDEAWATPTLDAEIRRAGLDRRDAALAATIVYGSLRVLPSLDAAVDRHVHKRPDKLDAYARAAFRAASFQILHLERVPAHAAVNAAVALVRRERGARLAGMVNAILRKVAAGRPDSPSLPERLELPDWVASTLETSLGAERAEAFLEHREVPPPIDLRLVGGRVERPALIAAGGRRVALDLHEPRLDQIPGLMKRLGLSPSLTLEAIDLSVGTGGLEGSFDLVLVDAPCTGLGTVHRRPELLLRLKPDDLDRLAALQIAILKNAADLVAEGGRLVYSVCSPTAAEGAEVAAQIPALGFREVGPGDEWEIGEIPVDPDGCVRLGPWLGGREAATDAYQIFRWIKV